jgi:hypothetical protein
MKEISELSKICADVHIETKERLAAARDLLDLRRELDFCMKKAKAQGKRVKVRLDVEGIDGFSVDYYLDVFETVKVMDLLQSKNYR